MATGVRPRDLIEGAVAGACAIVAMAAVAAGGLALVDAASVGPPARMTAAVVASAVGGSVDARLDVSMLGLPLGVHGGIAVMPLGVSLAGALTLAAVGLLLWWRRPAAGASVLAARSVGAVAAFLALLGVVCWVGRGSLDLGGLVADRPGCSVPGGRGGSGSIAPLLGNGPLGNGLDHLPVGFRVAVGRTLVGGLLWMLVVSAVALLVSRRVAVRAGLVRALRPALSSVVMTVLGATAVVVVGGAVAAVGGATRAVGVMLLGAPNVVFVAMTREMGVPWSGVTDGVSGGCVPSPPHGPGWALPVVAVVFLACCGLLTAARTPPSAGRWRDRVRRAAVSAVRLGAVMAVALPTMVVLAGISVSAGVSVFGFDMTIARFGLHGDGPLAALLGLVFGATAGFLGCLSLDGGRRVHRSTRHAPTEATMSPRR